MGIEKLFIGIEQYFGKIKNLVIINTQQLGNAF